MGSSPENPEAILSAIGKAILENIPQHSGFFLALPEKIGSTMSSSCPSSVYRRKFINLPLHHSDFQTLHGDST